MKRDNEWDPKCSLNDDEVKNGQWKQKQIQKQNPKKKQWSLNKGLENVGKIFGKSILSNKGKHGLNMGRVGQRERGEQRERERKGTFWGWGQTCQRQSSNRYGKSVFLLFTWWPQSQTKEIKQNLDKLAKTSRKNWRKIGKWITIQKIEEKRHKGKANTSSKWIKQEEQKSNGEDKGNKRKGYN